MTMSELSTPLPFHFWSRTARSVAARLHNEGYMYMMDDFVMLNTDQIPLVYVAHETVLDYMRLPLGRRPGHIFGTPETPHLFVVSSRGTFVFIV